MSETVGGIDSIVAAANSAQSFETRLASFLEEEPISSGEVRALAARGEYLASVA